MPNKARKKSAVKTKKIHHHRNTRKKHHHRNAGKRIYHGMKRKNHYTIPKKTSSQKQLKEHVDAPEVEKNIPEPRSAEKLDVEYNELKTTLTQRRKQGKDTFIEDMKMMLIPTKIQYLKADNNEKVYAFVKDLLQEIRASIQEMDTADAESVKQVPENVQQSQLKKRW